MSSPENKLFVSKMQEMLKIKGYDVKTSHLYDVLSQLEGYKNWHVASASKADLTKAISKFKKDVKVENFLSPDYRNYITSYMLNELGEKKEFDLLNPELSYWNYSITGSTGSGKSVLTNKLIAGFINESDNHKVVIFDAGGENNGYKKLTKLFNGKEVLVGKTLPRINLLEISLKTPNSRKVKEVANEIYKLNSDYSVSEISIFVKEFFYNMKYKKDLKTQFERSFPFNFDSKFESLLELQVGECVPSEEEILFIQETLEVLTGQSFRDSSDIIMDLFEKTVGRNPMLTDLYELFKKQDYASKNKIDLIRDCTKDGKYPMFDQETTLDLTNKFTLFDFKSLSHDKNLQKTYALLITNRVNKDLRSLKNARKLFVLDEMYHYTDQDILNKCYNKGLEEWRKTGVVSISISQSITDFSLNTFKNISCNIIGKLHSASAIKEVGEILDLSPETIEKMKGLGISKILGEDGIYATDSCKFLVVSSGSQEFIRNKLSKEEIEIYS